MHLFSVLFVLISMVAGSILAQSGSRTTVGSISDPFIFIDVGGDDAVGFLTTVPVESGEFAPALTPDLTQANNAYLNNSIFLLQPINSTAYFPIQTLTTQGPTGPTPEGLNYVAVKGSQSQGTTGFFVSTANDDVFTTNRNFGSFYHCSGVTVGTSGFRQVFWATASAKIPSVCTLTQFGLRSR